MSRTPQVVAEGLADLLDGTDVGKKKNMVNAYSSFVRITKALETAWTAIIKRRFLVLDMLSRQRNWPCYFSDTVSRHRCY
jgi:hypothetical protein